MAKISNWENLKAELERGQEEFAGIPNPTAEQCGMCQAYNYVYARMLTLDASEKKLDKA
jgi:hypothetical protein